jgi:hypothetical protein
MICKLFFPYLSVRIRTRRGPQANGYRQWQTPEMFRALTLVFLAPLQLTSRKFFPETQHAYTLKLSTSVPTSTSRNPYSLNTRSSPCVPFLFSDDFRKRTPTEQPPRTPKLVPALTGRGCHAISAMGPHGRQSLFSKPELLLFLSNSSSFILTSFSRSRSRPGSTGIQTRDLWISSYEF